MSSAEIEDPAGASCASPGAGVRRWQHRWQSWSNTDEGIGARETAPPRGSGEGRAHRIQSWLVSQNRNDFVNLSKHHHHHSVVARSRHYIHSTIRTFSPMSATPFVAAKDS